MRDAKVLELGPPTVSYSDRLSREVGILAGRLAGLLEGMPASRDVLTSGRTFLRSLFDAVGEGRPVATWRGSALERRPAAVTHPVDRLADGLDMSAIEVDLVILAGMPDEHEGLGSVLSTLHPRGEPRPTVGLAAQLLCRTPEERRLLRCTLEEGRAVGVGVLRCEGGGPFFDRSLVLADGLWSVLHGVDAWPSSLDVKAGPVTTSGLEEWLRDPSVGPALAALRRPEPRVVLVTAHQEEVAAHRAAAMAEWADVNHVRIALQPSLSLVLERLAAVHALARGLLPIFVVPPADGPAGTVRRAAPGFPGPVVLCCRAGTLVIDDERPVVQLAVARLSPSAREAMWRDFLPELSNDAADLAASFTVEPMTAFAVTTDARTRAALERRPTRLEDVRVSLRGRTNAAISAGVRVVRPTASWDHLVLPPDRLAQLREAVIRLRLQRTVLDQWGFLKDRPGARGVRLLFAGPPGTGKTLSAEVLARDLGLDLLVVDISRVVSKWIGETEKHLAEIFDAAESAQAVLLFDEADALFGKRTEVSDAHDRYANLETAYLLTRLERFEGLTILSTNMRRNMDSAFIRRLEFVVEFAEPGLAERRALWRSHIPAAAPLADDADLDALAALYPIVGALIRNAAVAAAFLAAAEGSLIARRHLVRAVRREYEKAGRALPGVHVDMSGE